MCISEIQIEEVRKLYERACKLQEMSPYDECDTAETDAIARVCEIIGVKLDRGYLN